MPSITVQYFAQIRRAAGCAEERIDVSAAAVGALLLELAARHPQAAPMLVADGQPNRSALVFVDDAPADANTLLPEGAVVTILTPMAGGAEPPSESDA